MARLTIADLQQMKNDGKKIAAGVCYDVQMTRILERAGVDLLSVGDSVSRTFLGMQSEDEFSLEAMLLFGKAVSRVAERAAVNVDMPTVVCNAGPKAVEAATRRIKEETGADMTKVDIRMQEEELFDDVLAVIEAGLPVYPQIGFPVFEPRHGGPETHEHIMKWANAVQDAGAVMIDLTNVTLDIYADVAKTMRIPVIGGQTGPESDGRIYVSYMLAGYRANDLDRTDGGPNAARYMLEAFEKTFASVHDATWEAPE
ncbi:MAG: 3-methyl-2-oxobutanoate hydroxymethyltransferase [Chloroflexota bacterium]|nr:3-methyl-2-oxobutanoate hydroxymethyltransferase [Chloroflexota bacterium]MDE2884385.1 3-methyl-2-oxobutanoate hydroxymethyltransferase [Chloroflexota bacterium]